MTPSNKLEKSFGQHRFVKNGFDKNVNNLAAIFEKWVSGNVMWGKKIVYFPAGLGEIFLARCYAVCSCRPCESLIRFKMARRPRTTEPPSCQSLVCNLDGPHYRAPDTASLCPNVYSRLISWIIRNKKRSKRHSNLVSLTFRNGGDVQMHFLE